MIEGTNQSAIPKFLCNKHGKMREKKSKEERFKTDITTVERRGD